MAENEKKTGKPPSGGEARSGTDMLGGDHLDQSRTGASVDEEMMTKGERRRGGQDVR